MSDLANGNSVERQSAINGAGEECATGVTSFGHFAQRVLPTLRQLRAARMAAEALARTGTSPLAASIGDYALESIGSIDAALRSTGVYDLSELERLEGDSSRMDGVCRVLDEVGQRLRVLSREVEKRTEKNADVTANSQVNSQVTALLALINAPLLGG